jgi:hypothetical protein
MIAGNYTALQLEQNQVVPAQQSDFMLLMSRYYIIFVNTHVVPELFVGNLAQGKE